MTTELRPADILAVRGGGRVGALIRLGQALQGKDNLSNHIAIVHHLDPSGTYWWCIEGRPGGVGWADSRQYLAGSQVLNNCGQPGRDDAGRAEVCKQAQLMLGTPYDWAAITDDTLSAFHLPELWKKDWNGTAPGHVVCSSFATFLYNRAGWARPQGDMRTSEPGDWDSFILSGGYNIPLPHP